MTELSIKLDGIGGQVLKGMKQRGWRIILANQNTVSTVKDKVVSVEVSYETHFEKLGKVEPKELWDKEMTEVYNEMIGTENRVSW